MAFKFNKGDRVVPHSKSVPGYSSFENCSHRREAAKLGQPFLYVTERTHTATNPDLNRYTLSYNASGGGNYYHEKDFDLYVEEGMTLEMAFEKVLKGEISDAYYEAIVERENKK